MQIVDLFSGIGGFSLAGKWMGWETIQFCEWNEFAQNVLKYHFPNVPIHGDIKTLNYAEVNRRIDRSKPVIITAGFPCQPFSTAGKRRGKEDERYGWPDCIEAVRSLAPDYCVFENVRGLINWNGGLVFDEVQADLEAEGYEVLPFLLPAAGVNAPHRRDRVWFVAYSDHRNDRRTPRQDAGEVREERVQQRDEVRKYAESGEVFGDAADPGSEQLQERTPKRNFKDKEKKRAGMDDRPKRPGNFRNAPNTDSIIGCKGWVYEKGQENAERYACSCNTRPDWKNWKNFPTQPPVCNGDDGISTGLSGITFPKWRNESIKAGGNAVVPQVVLQIFRAIEQYESLNRG